MTEMKALRFVGRKGSLAAAYTTAIADPDTTIVDSYTAKANVTLRFRLDDKPLEVRLPEEVRDLVDLAVAIYILDEVCPRRDAPDRWSREFDLVAPVQDPARWADATEALRAALSTLSGDDFAFEWCDRKRLGSIGSHRTLLPRELDTVCLFSGGLDSLLGAIKLLREDRRVLLVGHQADPATASAQTKLATGLRAKYPGRVRLIQCRAARRVSEAVSHKLPEKCEDSHRTRSFLFLSLAIAVARATGIDEIFIAENGLIALNPPLQPSRMGTATTRTAHPRYLLEFRGFLRAAKIFDGSIANPFLYQSKTDMLRDLDPKLASLVKRSVSCARPTRYQNKGVRHCGYCVPCIYRRAALLEASLDSPGDYAFDVFRELVSMSEHTQADFRALVRFAHRIAGSSGTALDALVVSNRAFDPAEASELGPVATSDYKPWSKMLKRWADDFLEKASRLSSTKTKRIVGLPIRRGKAK